MKTTEFNPSIPKIKKIAPGFYEVDLTGFRDITIEKYKDGWRVNKKHYPLDGPFKTKREAVLSASHTVYMIQAENYSKAQKWRIGS